MEDLKLKLKLVTTEESNNVPYIVNDSEGNFSAIKYEGMPLKEGCDLLKCSRFKEILDKNLVKGTKFLASIYNPTLYSLTPGLSENDEYFKIESDFIPEIPVQSLIREEVDSFNPDYFIDYENPMTQNSVRSIKACDNWESNTDELEIGIDERLQTILGYYEKYPDLNFLKEVGYSGGYSSDLSKNSIVVSLTSESTYTDTINLEDWIRSSGKCREDGGYYNISGKFDISYMYSKGEKIYSGMQTIRAFHYEDNLISEDAVLDLGDVQIEYLGYILKIYPVSLEVNEAIISDCTLTIGVL